MTSSPIISIIIVTWNRKDDVLRCIRSIEVSTFKDYEIIVVDNASTDGTVESIKKNRFDKTIVIENDTNLMASSGRNIGISLAKGDVLLFVDSDNIIDVNMIKNLYDILIIEKNIGMVGPIMYFLSQPKQIWYCGAEISLLSGFTKYISCNISKKSVVEIAIEVGHIPNIFMIKKEVLDLVGNFDELYRIMYEESDLAYRIRKAGFRVLLVTSAKAWHDVPYSGNILERMGLHSKSRAYLLARNRFIYLSKFSNHTQICLMLLLFQPIYFFYYTFFIITQNRFDLLKAFFSGTIAGMTVLIVGYSKIKKSFGKKL